MTVEHKNNASEAAQENDAEMERYGITKSQVYVFSYKEYRYSNFKDAVAQAKRDEARSNA